MTEKSETGVERTLGILLAKVEGIERAIQRGDEHRVVMHRRVDDLAAAVHDVKVELRDMKDDVAETKTVTDEVRRWKAAGMGALGVTGIASSALTAIVAAYWDEIKRALWG